MKYRELYVCVHVFLLCMQAGGECTVSRTLTHDLTQYPDSIAAGSPTKSRAH